MPRRSKTYGRLKRAIAGGEPARQYDLQRSNDQVRRIRNSARWQDVRRLKRDQNPLCEDCFAAGLTEPATQVDHVVSLRQRPDLAFVMDNLRSVCDRCHARKSAKERSG